MSNIHQFPLQTNTQTTSVDIDFVKWKMSDPDAVEALVHQVIDLIEFEVEFPVKGPGIDKFEDDLTEYLKGYFANV